MPSSITPDIDMPTLPPATARLSGSFSVAA